MGEQRRIGRGWLILAVPASAAALTAVLGIYLGTSRTEVFRSPDGRYQIRTFVNMSQDDRPHYLCVGFDVLDSTGRTLDHQQSGASDRMRWKIGWDPENRIWLCSSDIGTTVWQKETDADRWRTLSDEVSRRLPVPEDVNIPIP